VAIPLIALVAVAAAHVALKWNQHEMYLEDPSDPADRLDLHLTPLAGTWLRRAIRAGLGT
jgi:hypothetical protein